MKKKLFSLRSRLHVSGYFWIPNFFSFRILKLSCPHISDSLQIYYFPLSRADLKISRFTEYAGKEVVSRKKKLRIQKDIRMRLDGALDLRRISDDRRRKERNCRISKLTLWEVDIDHEESQKKSHSNLDADLLLMFILAYFVQTYKHDLQTLKYKLNSIVSPLQVEKEEFTLLQIKDKI